MHQASIFHIDARGIIFNDINYMQIILLLLCMLCVTVYSRMHVVCDSVQLYACNV